MDTFVVLTYKANQVSLMLVSHVLTEFLRTYMFVTVRSSSGETMLYSTFYLSSWRVLFFFVSVIWSSLHIAWIIWCGSWNTLDRWGKKLWLKVARTSGQNIMRSIRKWTAFVLIAVEILYIVQVLRGYAVCSEGHLLKHERSCLWEMNAYIGS